MDPVNNTPSLRSKPLQEVQEKLSAIDAELTHCRQRVDDLLLIATLKRVDAE